MGLSSSSKVVPALRLKQWLDEWNDYEFDSASHRTQPEPYLYMFSMPAGQLRALCDVYKRERTGAVSEGIQRYRDPSRTDKIQRYVRFGYPYGDLRAPQRTPANYALRKPGWLPTAIVINILVEGDTRRGRAVEDNHIVNLESDADGRWSLHIPDMPSAHPEWLAPFEVIDGQHRLWAFDADEDGEEPIPEDFELPVVAFKGLDIAWQAYLFWSINVSPKKINPSHAFDLYPLLRTQDWLERQGDLTVYREARAQEITEILYTHPASIWTNRINMLGDKGVTGVTQNAWVRALMGTFLNTGKGKASSGLFQANIEGTDEPLEWNRAQQAAFIICLWDDIRQAVIDGGSLLWIREFNKNIDEALYGRHSWLNQEQGVRAVLNVANDLFYYRASLWRLHEWRVTNYSDAETTAEDVGEALSALENVRFRPLIRELSKAIIHFDWRSLDAPGVKQDEQLATSKRSYRGGSGYSALRLDLMRELATFDNEIGSAASDLLASPY